MGRPTFNMGPGPFSTQAWAHIEEGPRRAPYKMGPAHFMLGLGLVENGPGPILNRQSEFERQFDLPFERGSELPCEVGDPPPT